MNIGFQEALFILLAVATTVLAVWCVIDVARRPASALREIDQNKLLWVILMVVAPVACWPASLALSIYYLRKVRPTIPAV